MNLASTSIRIRRTTETHLSALIIFTPNLKTAVGMNECDLWLEYTLGLLFIYPWREEKFPSSLVVVLGLCVCVCWESVDRLREPSVDRLG